MLITGTEPQQNATTVALDAPIVVTFDTEVDSDSVDASSIIVTVVNSKIFNFDLDVEQPTVLFREDNFLLNEQSDIVSGSVTCDGATVTFTPSLPWKTDTSYKVYISKGILGVDESAMSAISSLSFTTTSEDIVEPLPAVDGAITIIGNTVVFPTDTSSDTTLKVIGSEPEADSFFISSNEVRIEFNKSLTTIDDTKIVIYKYNILSDNPPDRLVLDTDYTVEVDPVEDEKLLITIGSANLSNNHSYKVVVAKSIDAQEDMIASHSLEFVTVLSPYYSSTKILQLRAGSIITAVPSVTLALSIYFASLQVNDLLQNIERKGYLESDNIYILKQNYVLYTALKGVLLNNFSLPMSDFIKKQLAEFNLSISNKTKIDLYNRLLGDIDNWLQAFEQVLSSLGNKGIFIQNSNNKNSQIGRTWISNQSPGINNTADYGPVYKKIWGNPITTLN